MTITHKLEYYGDSGLVERNKEWQKRSKKGLNVRVYTEAKRVGDFWHMIYGLEWEEN